MKKTLAALAVLGAFVGSTYAANVTVYGVVDEGLTFNSLDKDDGAGHSNTFQLESGVNAGSRFGLKGVESLGNGYNVGFVLENGFAADDGTMAQGGRLFGREAQVYVAGPFGKLGAGRVGTLVGGSGSYAITGNLTPLGTSYGNYTAQENTVMSFAFAGRVDNSLTYQSPTFGGFTVYAQYSFGTNVTNDKDTKQVVQTEGQSSADRYLAGGVTYSNGALKGVLAVDSVNYSSYNSVAGAPAIDNPQDSLTVTLGGSYDFGVAAVYLGGQYFNHARTDSFGGLVGVSSPSGKTSTVTRDNNYLTGFGLTGGVSAPVAGGTAFAGLAYLDSNSASGNATEFEYKRYIGSVGYNYPFSKRTLGYAVASYGQDKYDEEGKADVKPDYTRLVVGVTHKF